MEIQSGLDEMKSRLGSVYSDTVRSLLNASPNFLFELYYKSSGQDKSFYVYLVCEDLRSRGLVSRENMGEGNLSITYGYKPTEEGRPKLEEFVRKEDARIQAISRTQRPPSP